MEGHATLKVFKIEAWIGDGCGTQIHTCILTYDLYWGNNLVVIACQEEKLSRNTSTYYVLLQNTLSIRIGLDVFGY